MPQRFLGVVACLAVLTAGFTVGRIVDAHRQPRVSVAPGPGHGPLHAVAPLRSVHVRDTGQWNTVIPPGRRAIAVRVQEGAVLSRMIEPGAVIDLLGTVDGEDGPHTGTVLERVLVLGIDADADADTATLTVLVDPRQAERVAMAESGGALRVALRADDERVWIHPEVRDRLRRRLDRQRTPARPTPVPPEVP